jgi:hypothetical protein
MIVRQKILAGNVVLGGQVPVGMDFVKNPFNASVDVDIVSGSAIYSVEYTTDDLLGDPATLRWKTTVEFPSGTTSSALKAITIAVTGLRINIHSMTGEIRFTVIQGTRI